ncbi:type II toxin-antitoxin system HipA family toxin [Verminephrobacter aporrectodeae subsp. tuberculatae]|uniref:type II toxin-antitoxin system HipA family toxin n=1 Tax=Verminephrobacter aporrectodeae TaxID=1110389 RepID=UPI002243F4F5|nr:type II toxin-antitoxin system HipA family toxin [Verminephrobacter aporrectodeae]MCW8167007.1 type II toxin-antitoxin system HipA family toxin [Verminephrobacter aporrectodeae subsp. tuberculatae]MCW8171028.1 type II toxin-antitoxin system HipA family toxin [Verminephrobacter aporrectodeae subsp. tuberculatae]
MGQKILKVCLGEAGLEVGTLWFESAAGREHSSFQYDPAWLEHPRSFAIAPLLPLEADRRFFKSRNEQTSSLPLPIADTTPDSWGRSILRKDVRFNRRESGPLTEMDFLTAVDDFSRMGALRFREVGDAQPFLAAGYGGRHLIPPLLHLDQLGQAIASAQSDEPDMVALRRLRQVGTTLGGARPKCSIIDTDGSLAVAKFTSRYDTHAVERAEVLTLKLARICGLDVPKARIEMSDGLPVAIIQRFDRSDKGRIPFISAQTMLDAPTATGGTYVSLADTIRQHTASPHEEMHALFRRVGFSILVSNVDDHLKNHGFLYAGNGKWRLSPAFDVNPAPERFRELKTAIADPADPSSSIALLMDHSFCFEIDPDKAAQIVGSMAKTIQMNWRVLAHEAGMSRAEVGDYRLAFEHEEAKYAARAVAPTVVAPGLEPQAADTAKGSMQRQPRKDIAAATPQAQSDNVADGFDPSP